jgi:hypothetical protein
VIAPANEMRVLICAVLEAWKLEKVPTYGLSVVCCEYWYEASCRYPLLAGNHHSLKHILQSLPNGVKYIQN